MRATLAGTALITVLIALVVATVLGVGNRPLPAEVDAVLVEVRSDDVGQPLVEIEDAGDGALRPFGAATGTLLVRPDQFLCQGGSVTGLRAGLPVRVIEPAPVDVPEGEGPLVVADLAVIDCGDDGT